MISMRMAEWASASSGGQSRPVMPSSISVRALGASVLTTASPAAVASSTIAEGLYQMRRGAPASAQHGARSAIAATTRAS
jgi:hypothetical protein